MVLDLAKKISTESAVRTLAVTGLGVDSSKVDTCLFNNKDINMAMYDVLKDSNNSQDNDRIAYKTLCKALEDAKMNALIYQVLDGTPV